MGQIGNTNARGRDKFRRAILRALARRKGTVKEGLNELADKLVSTAAGGERWAIEGVADRIDGKAAQSVAVTGPDGNPLTLLVAGAEQLRAKIRGE